MTQSYAQLLVHLDATPQTEQRLQIALQIAKAQDAAVTALYAVTPSVVEVPFPPNTGTSIASALREIDDQRREQAQQAFERRLQQSGLRPSWSEVQDAAVQIQFIRQAFYCDLMVLGQHEEGRWSGVPSDFVENVLAASGKPALILPYQSTHSSIGQTVVIAWKATREAARAVSAALPLLQRARQVHVLSWPGARGEEDQGSDQPLNLASYLKLHQIDATWHVESGAEPQLLGELLLSRAFDLQADLLVMGCYGHSRAREWILGGTSRTLLHSMTLPLLMAH